MHSHPTKIKVLEVQSNNVLIRCLLTDQETFISANDLVRRVDNGTYELVNFIEPPAQFDLFEEEQKHCLDEQLEMPDFRHFAKPVRLFELEEMMA